MSTTDHGDQQITVDIFNNMAHSSSKVEFTHLTMFFESITMIILTSALLFANAEYLPWEDDLSFWDDLWELPEQSVDGTISTWLHSSEVWADLLSWLSQPRELSPQVQHFWIILSPDQIPWLSYFLGGSHLPRSA